MGNNQLGWRNARTDGSQPGAEGVPHERGKADRQVLKQSLANDASLDEDMIGVELAFDGVAVVERLAMQILIAISAAKRLHVLHPEMVRERTDQTHRLLKAVLDLKAQAIQANDLNGAQGDVRAHQQARASGRM